MPNYSNLFSPPTSAKSKFQSNPFAIRKFGKNPLGLFDPTQQQQLIPAAPPPNPQAQIAAEEDAPFDFASKYKELTSNRPSRLAYRQALESEAPKISRGKWAKLGAALAAGGSALGGMRADQAAQFGLSSYYAPQERSDAEYEKKLSRLEKSAQFEDQDLALGLDAIKSDRDDYYKRREDKRQQTTSKLAEAAGRREEAREPWTLKSLEAEAATRGVVFQQDEDGYTYAHNMVDGTRKRMGKTGKNDDEQINFYKRQLGVKDEFDVKSEDRGHTRAKQLLGMGHTNDLARMRAQSDINRGDFAYENDYMDKKGLDRNGNPKLKVDETNLAIRNAVNTMENSGQLPPGSSRFLRESQDGFITVGGAPTGNYGGGEERNPEIEQKLREVVSNVSGMANLPGMIPGGGTTRNSPPAEPAPRGTSSIHGKNWFGVMQDSLSGGGGGGGSTGSNPMSFRNPASPQQAAPVVEQPVQPRQPNAMDFRNPQAVPASGGTLANTANSLNAGPNAIPFNATTGHMPRNAGANPAVNPAAEAFAASVNPQIANKLNYPAAPPPAAQAPPPNPAAQALAGTAPPMQQQPRPQSAGPGNPFMNRAANLSSNVAQGIPGQAQAAGDIPPQANADFIQPMQQAAARGNMQAAAQQAAAQRAARQPAPQAVPQAAQPTGEAPPPNASRTRSAIHSVPMRSPNGEIFYTAPEAVPYWKEQGATANPSPFKR